MFVVFQLDLFNIIYRYLLSNIWRVESEWLWLCLIRAFGFSRWILRDLDFLLANKKCMLSKLINLFNPVAKTATFANNVDPDEMAHDEPSHQDLHCLPFCSWLTTNFLLGVMDVSEYRDGRIYFRNSGLKGINLVLKLGQTRFCLYIFNKRKQKNKLRIG